MLQSYCCFHNEFLWGFGVLGFWGFGVLGVCARQQHCHHAGAQRRIFDLGSARYWTPTVRRVGARQVAQHCSLQFGTSQDHVRLGWHGKNSELRRFQLGKVCAGPGGRRASVPVLHVAGAGAERHHGRAVEPVQPGRHAISGAGMIESLACFSVEKLVIDAESIASAQRLVRGIEVGGETLATAMFAQTGLSGEFLKLKETRALFRQEQHIPSPVIDRSARGSELPSEHIPAIPYPR